MFEVIWCGLITAIMGINLAYAIKSSGYIGEFREATKRMNGWGDRLEKLEKRMDRLEWNMTLLLNSHNPKKEE